MIALSFKHLLDIIVWYMFDSLCVIVQPAHIVLKYVRYMRAYVPQADVWDMDK